MIAIGIVGHIRRMRMIEQLKATLGPHCVSIDDGTRGVFLSHHRVWSELTFSGAEWCVVLEDDAVPVPALRQQLQAALDVTPSPVVSLYLGRDRPRFIQPAIRGVVDSGVDTCWLTTQHMLHAVGIAMHRSVIAPMLTHTREVPGAALLPIDRAIGHWVKYGDDVDTVAYSWPSLVDHANQGSVIDVHPDGEPRGPVLYLDEGQAMPALSNRVAWRVGQRAQWDSSSHVLA